MVEDIEWSFGFGLLLDPKKVDFRLLQRGSSCKANHAWAQAMIGLFVAS